KLNPESDILDFSFPEFILNEILHKGDRIKNEVSDTIVTDIDFLYRGNIDKTNDLNILGYLIINQLSIVEYNNLVSPYSDYRDIHLSSEAFTNYLIYAPKYAFFEDLVNIFNAVFLEDFFNESTHSEKWKSYKNTFTDNPNDLTPI